MKEICLALISIGVCVVLPLTCVWMVLRRYIRRDELNKDIVLAALEKDASINVEELVRKINNSDKLLKEKLLAKFQYGLIFSLIGLVLVVIAIIMGCAGGDNPLTLRVISSVGAILITVGIAFFISFYLGKKMLSKEMEIEEKKLQQS